MAGIGWGLLSALLWGSAAVVSARASRLVGPWAVVAWVALIGIVVTLPIALATGTPDGVPGVDWLWAAIAGSAAIGGLFLAYWAVRIGQVSLVTPIIATDGAIAAVIAVLAGEEIAAAAAGVLAVIAVGVTLASVQRGSGNPAAATPGLAIALALAAACIFALNFFGAGQVEEMSAIWVVAVARMIGAVGVTLPAALARRLTLTRQAVPYAVAAALLEAGGYMAYVLGSRDGVAVPAVLASQYAVVAMIGGYVVFKERLTPLQLAGVALTMSGVGALTAVQA